MELLLQREPSKNGYTEGTLYADGAEECKTLEDVVRDDPNPETAHNEGKVYGETAIPAGRYRVVLTESPKFRKVLPEILKVPGYTGIRIHGGVHAGHTLGCVLVGTSVKDGRLSGSADAMTDLMALLTTVLEGGEQCWIEVRNA